VTLEERPKLSYVGPAQAHVVLVEDVEYSDLCSGAGLIRRVITHRSLDHYELHLPWSTNPIPMNGGRGSPFAHARKVRDARATAHFLATQLPRLDRIRVELVQYVTTRRVRDEDNLGALAKALVDGLRDDPKKGLRGIVPDDTRDYVERMAHRIEPAPEGMAAHFRLRIWTAGAP
jgi:hypothetical protein